MMMSGKEEEKEFEMLLSEIPHVTSPVGGGGEEWLYSSGGGFGRSCYGSGGGSSSGVSGFLSSRTSGTSSPIGERSQFNSILDGLNALRIGPQWGSVGRGVDWGGELGQLGREFGYPTLPADPVGVGFYDNEVFDANSFVYGNNSVFGSDWRPSAFPFPMGIGDGIAMDKLVMEDSLIIQGKDLEILAKAGRVVRRDSGNAMLNVDQIRSPVRHHVSPFRLAKFDSLVGIRGSIYLVAKDQQGCRFLQRKLDDGAVEDLDMIFEEIIDHVSELMVNPFANYLMQKVFEVCSEEQRLRVILVLTQHPYELVQISQNNHGTRAVQKLIETLRTHQQTVLVISALRPGFLILIKDLNGHHVIQRCLQFLSVDQNKFIFDAAAKHCVNIATDQHGCCVLQRCIAHSTGAYRMNLVMQIAVNGLQLAYHPFGNYAVQFIMDLNNPLVNAKLMSQFKGSFADLSRSKFGSNVVEKCVKKWEEGRRTIILELLSTPHFDMLLQHQYANYVILRALSSTKGPLRDALVAAIQPHASVLRTSPYCKKIFSKPYFKKCTSY